jgi:hypothetical protein
MTETELTLESARAGLVELVAESRASGLAPTASALATKLGLKRPTLYSRFPEVISELRLERGRLGMTTKGRPRDEVVGELRRAATAANRSRRDLEAQLATYAEQVRRLTIDNVELRRELELARGVTSIVDRTRGNRA